MKLKSDFALLSILRPDHKKMKALKGNEVIIKGTISDAWGSFDGTDQEFEINVTDVEVKEPINV